MSDDDKPVLVGMNHVALEVGDIDAALEFWNAIFDIKLRGRSDTMAFIDMGDQFIALAKTETPHRDDHRHFGLIVDDRENVRARAEAAGAEILPSGRLDMLDPWGNFIQVIEYQDIQFSKTDAILRGMGLSHLEKTDAAKQELAKKGMV
ncbi:MAG: VOC family protein [Pseudomonadota bacterium]